MWLAHDYLPNEGRQTLSIRGSTHINISLQTQKDPQNHLFSHFTIRIQRLDSQIYTQTTHPRPTQQPKHRNTESTASKHQPIFLYITIGIARICQDVSIRISITTIWKRKRGWWVARRRICFFGTAHAQTQIQTHTHTRRHTSKHTETHFILIPWNNLWSCHCAEPPTNSNERPPYPVRFSTNSQNFVHKPSKIGRPSISFTRFPKNQPSIKPPPLCAKCVCYICVYMYVFVSFPMDWYAMRNGVGWWRWWWFIRRPTDCLDNTGKWKGLCVWIQNPQNWARLSR